MDNGIIKNFNPNDCKVCSRLVTDEDDGLICDTCERWVHADCTENGREKFEDDENRLVWTCSAACRKNIPNNVLDDLMDLKQKDATTDDLMKAMRVIIVGLLKPNRSCSCEKLTTQVKQLNNEVTQLKVKVEQNEAKVVELRREIGNLKQLQLNNNAICFNVPKAIVENTNDFKKLLVDNNFQTRGKVQRMFQAKKAEYANVLLEFESSEKKFKFIKEFKEKKLTLEENKKMFIAESLSYENKELLMEAKSCLETYKFKWTKNGRVYVRKEKGETLWIKNSARIKELQQIEKRMQNTSSSDPEPSATETLIEME